jgi:beta-lactamase superfamily II metal-dependent hydrolase
MHVSILNVGQGSCTVVVTSSGTVTVVDGGDESSVPGRTDVNQWMLDRGVERIDFLVLSHLHRDHAQGLLHLARRFPVGVAFLPYPRFSAPRPSATWLSGFLHNAHVDSPHGQLQLVTEYLALMAELERQGTSIRFPARTTPYGGSSDVEDSSTAASSTTGSSTAESSAAASSTREGNLAVPGTLWELDGYRLLQVYPLPGDALLTPHLVKRLGHCDDAELTRTLDELSEGTNAESAVLALVSAQPTVPTVVISGDLSTSTVWDDVLTRLDVTGGIWILPHHGAPDGAQPHHVTEMKPRALIASVSPVTAQTYSAHWQRLEAASGVSVFTTYGRGTDTVSELEFGDLGVSIGV